MKRTRLLTGLTLGGAFLLIAAGVLMLNLGGVSLLGQTGGGPNVPVALLEAVSPGNHAVSCPAQDDCKAAVVSGQFIDFYDCNDRSCTAPTKQQFRIDASNEWLSEIQISCPSGDRCALAVSREEIGFKAIHLVQCQDAQCSSRSVGTMAQGGSNRPFSLSCPAAGHCRLLYIHSTQTLPTPEEAHIVACSDDTCSQPIETRLQLPLPSPVVGTVFVSLSCPQGTPCRALIFNIGYVSATASANDPAAEQLLFVRCTNDDCSQHQSRVMASQQYTQQNQIFYMFSPTALHCFDGQTCAFAYDDGQSAKFTRCTSADCGQATTRSLGIPTQANIDPLSASTSIACPAQDDCKVTYITHTRSGEMADYQKWFLDCNDAECSCAARRAITGTYGWLMPLSCAEGDACRFTGDAVSARNLAICADATCGQATATACGAPVSSAGGGPGGGVGQSSSAGGGTGGGSSVGGGQSSVASSAGANACTQPPTMRRTYTAPSTDRFAKVTMQGYENPPRDLLDLSGDGRLDLLLFGGTGGRYFDAMLGQGGGAFSTTPRQSLALGSGTPPPDAQGVALGDINGDTNADMAYVIGFGSPGVSARVGFRLGDGGGSFGSSYGSAVALSNAQINDIYLEDVTADGKRDLLIVGQSYIGSDYQPSDIWVAVQQAGGTFAAPILTDLPITFNPRYPNQAVAFSVIVRDMNGDGKKDLVVADPKDANNSHAVHVLLGDGAGSFSATTALEVGSPPANHAVGDLDGDGSQDVVAWIAGSFISFYGNGQGAFVRGPTLPAPSAMGNIAAVDVTGDGRADIVAAFGYGTGSVPGAGVGVVPSRANRTFGAWSTVLTLPGNEPAWLRFAQDVSNDGVADIGVEQANGSASRSEVYVSVASCSGGGGQSSGGGAGSSGSGGSGGTQSSGGSGTGGQSSGGGGLSSATGQSSQGGNSSGGGNTSSEGVSFCGPVCGDGMVSDDEECDDGNNRNNDGCSALCEEELGWICVGSNCAAVCGDGTLAGNEGCDDGNTRSGDGCSSTCRIEVTASSSSAASSVCTACAAACVASSAGLPFCSGYEPRCPGNATVACPSTNAYGNPLPAGTTPICNSPGGIPWCNFGPVTDADAICIGGQSAACQQCLQTCSTGSSSSGRTSPPGCGNGFKEGAEECDDGDTVGGDGCSAICLLERGWQCVDPSLRRSSSSTRGGGSSNGAASSGACRCPQGQIWDNAQERCRTGAVSSCGGAPAGAAVCGCDGVTYASQCIAWTNGVRQMTLGACLASSASSGTGTGGGQSSLASSGGMACGTASAGMIVVTDDGSAYFSGPPADAPNHSYVYYYDAGPRTTRRVTGPGLPNNLLTATVGEASRQGTFAAIVSQFSAGNVETNIGWLYDKNANTFTSFYRSNPISPLVVDTAGVTHFIPNLGCLFRYNRGTQRTAFIAGDSSYCASYVVQQGALEDPSQNPIVQLQGNQRMRNARANSAGDAVLQLEDPSLPNQGGFPQTRLYFYDASAQTLQPTEHLSAGGYWLANDGTLFFVAQDGVNQSGAPVYSLFKDDPGTQATPAQVIDPWRGIPSGLSIRAIAEGRVVIAPPTGTVIADAATGQVVRDLGAVWFGDISENGQFVAIRRNSGNDPLVILNLNDGTETVLPLTYGCSSGQTCQNAACVP